GPARIDHDLVAVSPLQIAVSRERALESFEEDDLVSLGGEGAQEPPPQHRVPVPSRRRHGQSEDREPHAATSRKSLSTSGRSRTRSSFSRATGPRRASV